MMHRDGSARTRGPLPTHSPRQIAHFLRRVLSHSINNRHSTVAPPCVETAGDAQCSLSLYTLVETQPVSQEEPKRHESKRSATNLLHGDLGLAGGSPAGTQRDEQVAGPAICLIGGYLLLVAVLFGWAILAIFPETGSAASGGSGKPVFGEFRIGGWTILGPPPAKPEDSVPYMQLTPERGLIFLAMLAGVLGSFMHAAQSFAAYVGNKELKASWVWWYLLRPFIGAVLGVLFYFVIRAGMMGADSNGVSPYGVVALGGLAGWFSKNATEKLAEVFDTLFRIDPARRARYKDTLAETPEAPKIASITPDHVGRADSRITIKGESFAPNAYVTINNARCRTISSKPDELIIEITPEKRPAEPGDAIVKVVNPTPSKTESTPATLRFD